MNPTNITGQWTVEEEIIFYESHKIFGNKWTELAKYLPKRSANSIKNHFYTIIRKIISSIVILKSQNIYSEIKNIDVKYLYYITDILKK